MSFVGLFPSAAVVVWLEVSFREVMNPKVTGSILVSDAGEILGSGTSDSKSFPGYFKIHDVHRNFIRIEGLIGK